MDAASSQMISVEARPGPFAFEPRSTAVIVVDMQNDFGQQLGMFGCAGIDISSIQAIVPNIAKTIAEARRCGITMIFLKMEFRPDLSNAGDERAPNLVKHRPLGIGEIRQAPDGTSSRVLIEQQWSTDIISDLTPEPSDLVVSKHRYSGFFETNLDALLKERGIRSLLFTGATTSVCVESTLRDAFFRDYQCLLLSDCTAEPIGNELLRSNHDATLLVVELLFGWVTDSTSLLSSLSA